MPYQGSTRTPIPPTTTHHQARPDPLSFFPDLEIWIKALIPIANAIREPIPPSHTIENAKPVVNDLESRICSSSNAFSSSIGYGFSLNNIRGNGNVSRTRVRCRLSMRWFISNVDLRRLQDHDLAVTFSCSIRPGDDNDVRHSLPRAVVQHSPRWSLFINYATPKSDVYFPIVYSYGTLNNWFAFGFKELNVKSLSVIPTKIHAVCLLVTYSTVYRCGLDTRIIYPTFRHQEDFISKGGRCTAISFNQDRIYITAR